MKKYLSISIRTQNDKGVKKGSKYYKSFSEQREHNLRIEKMDNDYLLKPELQKLNINNEKYKSYEELKPLFEKMENDYKEHYKRKLPSNTKTLINGLITFSETMQQDINKYGRKELGQQIYNFIKLEYGEVINFSLHMDETTPHFHFTTLNYDFKNHKTFSQSMKNSIKENNGRNDLQDRLEKYLKEKIPDFDYERGELRNIKNYHTKRFKQNEHLKKQEEQIKDLIEQNKKLNETITEKEKKIETLKLSISKLEEDKQQTIISIIEDLELLTNEKETTGFIKKVERYVDSVKKDKLDKLIEKYQKSLDKKKSTSNIMSKL